MRVYLDQIGCRLNYSEMETLARRLRAAGHQVVDAPELAQVCVFNSCTVTQDAARSSRQRIRQLHRANPAARIALTGCWSTLAPDKAAALPGVALTVDNTRKDLLPLLLEPWSAELDDPADLARIAPNGNPFDGAAPEIFNSAGDSADNAAERKPRTRAFIKVQDGCDNRCTFCVVTLARGQGRSRPVAEVVAEVQALVREGVQEAVLTGVHLGSYGRDLAGAQAGDLRRLIDALLTETDIARLRLSSLEPWELADGFFELWQRWPHRLCPHLHLPLQTGTDALLRRMARRCTVASFRQLVTEARAAIPDLILTTDLIVGFPGESERDFAQGLEFVQEMRFAHAHIFPYSPRPGTAAAAFAPQVEVAVKKERSRRAHAVVAETGRQERSRFVGTQRAVLWEGAPQPADDPALCWWAGWTDNYLRVTAPAPVTVAPSNRLTRVRLDALRGDALQGTILFEEAASFLGNQQRSSFHQDTR